MTTDDSRMRFSFAARAFCDLVDQVGADQWSVPALGVWDIRALVGHASRGMSNLETYRSEGSEPPTITDPAEWFVAMLPDPSEDPTRRRRDAEHAERGRKAGEELGEDPAPVVRQVAERMIAVVMATPTDAVLTTRVGSLPLSSYLPTRTFELAVHSLDLARALEVTPPQSLSPAVSVACELAGRVAACRGRGADLLMALTGRSRVPLDVTIF